MAAEERRKRSTMKDEMNQIQEENNWLKTQQLIENNRRSSLNSEIEKLIEENHNLK